MENTLAFTHGFLLALGLILPLGVQNVFVFSQGAAQRALVRALPAVITAAVSDTVLILAAVFGVSVAVLSYAWLKTALLLTGIAFLSYIGWLTWRNGNLGELDKEQVEDWPVKRQVIFALSVSLLNPHAILDTIGIIGTSSLSYSGNAFIAFSGACIMVSWLWFFGLAIAGSMIRSLDRSGMVLRNLNKASALIMWISALYLINNF